LQEINCDWVQGYLLSYPLKKADLMNTLSQHEATYSSLHNARLLS
jgi:EAL domain-containing protein (putative c-di-GMP-specific phosphodiesterase class I)